MTIKASKMGPGTLLLGTTPLDITAQITQCVLNPSENVNEGDITPTLSGEELIDDDDVSYTYTLDATLFQDLTAAGVVDWSYDHKGEWHDFVFVPNNEEARGLSGQVRVSPIAIGGEVKKRNTSDISWKARGADAAHPDPIFGEYDAVDDEVTEDV